MNRRWLLALPLLFIAWLRYANFPFHNGFTVSALVFSNLVVLTVIYLAPQACAQWRTLSKQAKIGFAVVGLLYSLLAAIVYPGWIGSDLHLMIESLAAGTFGPWNSLTYSMAILGNYFLTGTAYGLIVLHFILMLYIALESLAWLESLKAPKWRLNCLVALLCLPLSQVLVLFHMRDTLFSILLVAVMVSILSRSKHTEISTRYLFFLGTALSLLMDLRQDGKILIISALALPLVWPAIRTRINLLFFFSPLLVGLLYFNQIANRFLNYQPYNSAYLLTLLAPPVGEILKNIGPENLSDSENKIIDETFGIDYMLDRYDRYLAYYHDRVSPERRNNFHLHYEPFKSIAFNLIQKYPNIYLKWRRDFVIRLTNLDWDGSAVLFSMWRTDFPWERTPLAGTVFSQSQIPGGMSSAYMNFVDWTFRSLPYPFRVTLSSILFPLCFLLLGLLKWRTQPLIAWCAATLLLRLMGIFSFATMAFFQYLLAIWLGGWIMALGLFKLNKKSPKST